MVSNRSVLIVDPSEENRSVLKTILEHRGLRIFEASRADEGLEMARSHRPDLIVVDLEVSPAEDEAVSAGYEAESRENQTQLILLGNVRRAPATGPRDRFVSKPYHYAPLIRKIESLLESAA
ncbi:MAG: response regulator [Pirellulales bacterium]|nr:response regulator [Pirellulales bacterium]